MSPASQPPLLREFIKIPEQTSTSYFVLELTDGVSNAAETLREYVITDRLVTRLAARIRPHVALPWRSRACEPRRELPAP